MTNSVEFKALQADMEVLETMLIALLSSLRDHDRRIQDVIRKCFVTAEDVMTSRVLASKSRDDCDYCKYMLTSLEDLRATIEV